MQQENKLFQHTTATIQNICQRIDNKELCFCGHHRMRSFIIIIYIYECLYIDRERDLSHRLRCRYSTYWHLQKHFNQSIGINSIPIYPHCAVSWWIYLTLYTRTHYFTHSHEHSPNSAFSCNCAILSFVQKNYVSFSTMETMAWYFA